MDTLYRGLKVTFLGEKQFVNYNGTKSSLHDVLCGIPQGSILGPLLFLIYINDLPCALKFTRTILFADDTNLYASHNNLNTLWNEINKDIESLVTWFKANKLSLNTGKTFYMVFSTKCTTHDLNIVINGNNIERKESNEFLDIYLDQNLRWDRHIMHCKAKLTSSIYAMNSAKRFLSSKQLLLLYNSLITSYLNYGLSLWGSAPAAKIHLNKLVVLQKKAMRIIAHAPYNAHTNDLFLRFRLLKLYDIYTKPKWAHTCLRNYIPYPLNHSFVITARIVTCTHTIRVMLEIYRHQC